MTITRSQFYLLRSTNDIGLRNRIRALDPDSFIPSFTHRELKDLGIRVQKARSATKKELVSNRDKVACIGLSTKGNPCKYPARYQKNTCGYHDDQEKNYV